MNSQTMSSPVNSTWYFAEGRVGKGFREYLTLDNPGMTTCTVSITYLYTQDGSTTSQTKVLANVSIGPASRYTESVNQDLGSDASSSSGDNVASIVDVSNPSTCAGVMVERPIYFTNYHGISSGTDVVGATHLGTTFFFADIASDPSHISYLTVLNPPGNNLATVTVSYYAGSSLVGLQTADIPGGSRGTIAPGQLTLPTHSFAVVTSTSPVIVERPSYFLRESEGVAGAFDVVGVQSAANDWLFAEGYTGAGTQENLTLANPNTAPASVSVILKSQVGTIKTFTLTLGAQSQTIWNVNGHNTANSTPEVSAEVKANVGIVVQREMYFQYHHAIKGIPTVTASGGSDAFGLTGVVPHSYSFAEGYTNSGYNEWLTLQNPSITDETVTVTLTSGTHRVFTFQQRVGANERQTVDITATVVRALQPHTDKDANAISMTVQSSGTFVAERPEYYTTSGSNFVVQGGTDTIGYTGN